MLRFKDFTCATCGTTFEECVVIGDGKIVKHCGKPAREMVGAPMVHYKPHYSHALGRRVNTFKEEERALEQKNGSWIASKDEANRLYDTDQFDTNVTVKKARKEQILKAAKTAAEKLTSSGAISLPD